MQITNNLVSKILDEASKIRNHYHSLALNNGDYFNIFSILKIERKEVTTHSRFLAELLNPNGVHGFKDTFLKLFIQEINTQLENKIHFNPQSCSVEVEAYHGVVTNTSGGSIDILIKEHSSHQHSILIENKIDAQEQHNQLLRYKNAYPKGTLIFLTLFGKKSNQKSSENIDYISLSYKKNITSWLIKCREIANTNPSIREIISQYLNLIKKLTNQNSKSLMDEKLTDLLLADKTNFESFQALSKASTNIKHKIIIETVLPIINEIAKKHNLKLDHNLLDNWPGFIFSNKKMQEKDIKICFSSSAEIGISNVVFGFQPGNQKNRSKELESKIDSLFKKNFNRYSKSGYKNWISLSYLDSYLNWENFDTLKKIHFEKEIFKDVVVRNKV